MYGFQPIPVHTVEEKDEILLRGKDWCPLYLKAMFKDKKEFSKELVWKASF